MELDGTYCKKDRITLDQKDHELYTTLNTTLRNAKKEVDKRNEENCRQKFETNGHGFFEMERNSGRPHPAVERKKGKEKKKICIVYVVHLYGNCVTDYISPQLLHK